MIRDGTPVADRVSFRRRIRGRRLRLVLCAGSGYRLLPRSGNRILLRAGRLYLSYLKLLDEIGGGGGVSRSQGGHRQRAYFFQGIVDPRSPPVSLDI